MNNMPSALRRALAGVASFWRRIRSRINTGEVWLEARLSLLHDSWLQAGAALAVVSSAAAAAGGVWFESLPNTGFWSPQSLLFLGFLLASTCIGLCKSISTKVWAVLLLLAGLGMWTFSAFIG